MQDPNRRLRAEVLTSDVAKQKKGRVGSKTAQSKPSHQRRSKEKE